MKVIYDKNSRMITNCAYHYCCEKVRLLEKDLTISLCNGAEGIGIYFLKVDMNNEGLEPDFKIDYCPFCGEKINIINK